MDSCDRGRRTPPGGGERPLVHEAQCEAITIRATVSGVSGRNNAVYPDNGEYEVAETECHGGEEKEAQLKVQRLRGLGPGEARTILFDDKVYNERTDEACQDSQRMGGGRHRAALRRRLHACELAFRLAYPGKASQDGGKLRMGARCKNHVEPLIKLLLSQSAV